MFKNAEIFSGRLPNWFISTMFTHLVPPVYFEEMGNLPAPRSAVLLSVPLKDR
jgi:hypothetical protein